MTEDIDARWDDAIAWPINNVVSLSIAGAGVTTESGFTENRNGHTCFVRILLVGSVLRNTLREEHTTDGNLLSMTVQDVVRSTLLAIEDLGPPGTKLAIGTAEELLEIGAVWIIQLAPRSRKSKPRRATPFDDFVLTGTCKEWKDIVIRIHYGAKRYEDVHRYDWGKRCDAVSRGISESPQEKKGLIIDEDFQAGYAIINKPPGIPVHGYVYNCVENVAHMYGEALRKRHPNESCAICISVPQRLDNDTSGVLVVATQSSFSSYMGRLLEAKTSTHVKHKQQSDTASCVTKCYKCLVCLKAHHDIDRLRMMKESEDVVTHYLSTRRTLPRVFSEVPLQEDEKGILHVKWLDCHLRITSVGFKDSGEPYVRVRGSKGAENLAKNLWGLSHSIGVAALPFAAVTQVEVELLTGRTHQIRGQLAALGFPLVGDVLYGGGVPAGDDNTCRRRMGLHCSQLSFPNPEACNDEESSTKKDRQRLIPSSKINTFRWDDAWWNEYVK